LTLLARLDVDEVDWVGTSMGGLLGMLLAAQPNSPIRRLVMNDIGAFLPMPALQHISRNLEAPPNFRSLAAVEAHLRKTRNEWGEISDAQWKQLAIHGSRETERGYRLHFDPTLAAPPRFRSRPGFSLDRGRRYHQRCCAVRSPRCFRKGSRSRCCCTIRTSCSKRFPSGTRPRS
jgi:pimeloyl-ACP methyl ester carboxylesterase